MSGLSWKKSSKHLIPWVFVVGGAEYTSSSEQPRDQDVSVITQLRKSPSEKASWKTGGNSDSTRSDIRIRKSYLSEEDSRKAEEGSGKSSSSSVESENSSDLFQRLRRHRGGFQEEDESESREMEAHMESVTVFWTCLFTLAAVLLVADFFAFLNQYYFFWGVFWVFRALVGLGFQTFVGAAKLLKYSVVCLLKKIIDL